MYFVSERLSVTRRVFFSWVQNSFEKNVLGQGGSKTKPQNLDYQCFSRKNELGLFLGSEAGKKARL
jgi:hypothetical protein